MFKPITEPNNLTKTTEAKKELSPSPKEESTETDSVGSDSEFEINDDKTDNPKASPISCVE